MCKHAARAAGILLLAGCLLAAVVLRYPGAVGLEAYEIASGSMAPAYPRGSVVYTRAGKTPAPGDVIAFYDKSGAIVVHRAIGVGAGLAVTKGDANREPDPDPVASADIIGTVVFSLPRIGRTGGWLVTAALCAGACLGLALLAAGLCLRDGPGREYENGGETI